MTRPALRVPAQICFPCRPEEDSGRDYRERERDYERDQERILRERERERLKRQEEERRRQKERYEKEKAFKRKEEELKKEKEAVRDKGKKTESTESVGSSEKTEKKEEVVKRDRIRNKVLLFVISIFMRIFFCSASVKERASSLFMTDFLKGKLNYLQLFQSQLGPFINIVEISNIHKSRMEKNRTHPLASCNSYQLMANLSTLPDPYLSWILSFFFFF